MMHIIQKLPCQNQKIPSHNPLLLFLRLSQNAILIIVNCVHCLVGLVQTSSRRLLSTPRSTSTLLKKAYKSPNPALNVYLCEEDVACYIAYSDVSAIYDGSTAAVIFVAVNSQVTDVYGIKTDKQFVNAFEETIIQRVAPLTLISNSGQAIVVSHMVIDIL
jgi:hypothetical protein